MGTIYEYFSAPGDDTALAAYRAGGGPEQRCLPTLPVKGIEPYVQLGFAEALITDSRYDDVTERAASTASSATPRRRAAGSSP